MSEYEGILEVQVLPPSLVNAFLEGGYRLLSIESITMSGRHPTESLGRGAGAYFVEVATRYVVGRTADVAPILWEDADEETVPE